MYDFDLRGVIWFMWFGIACAAVLAIVVVPAAAVYGLWWLSQHLVLR